MKNILLIAIVCSFFSCTKESKTKEIGERFFTTFSQRTEVDKMLSFYAQKFDYENIGFESETDNPKFLYEEFYGWKDPAIKYNGKESVKIDEIVTSDSSIIARGTTLPYTYNGKEVKGTRFVIWLELDKDLKIRKQTDWFDYPMEEIIEAYYLKNNMKIE